MNICIEEKTKGKKELEVTSNFPKIGDIIAINGFIFRVKEVKTRGRLYLKWMGTKNKEIEPRFLPIIEEKAKEEVKEENKGSEENKENI